MPPFSETQLDFVSRLYSAAGGLTIDIEKYLLDCYFTSATGRALILQPAGQFGYFYLAPGLFEAAARRHKELSDFISVVAVLDALKKSGRIFYLHAYGMAAKDTAFYAVGGSLASPRSSGGKIVLNERGDFTSRLDTINSKDEAELYCGVRFDDKLFDAVNAVVRGIVYLPPDIAELIGSAGIPASKPKAGADFGPENMRGFLPCNTRMLLNVLKKKTARPVAPDQTTSARINAAAPAPVPSPPSPPATALHAPARLLQWGPKTLHYLLTLLVSFLSWTVILVHDVRSGLAALKEEQSLIGDSVEGIRTHLKVPPRPPARQPVSPAGAPASPAHRSAGPAPSAPVPSAPAPSAPAPSAPAPSAPAPSAPAPSDPGTPAPAQARVPRFGFDLSKWNSHQQVEQALAMPHVYFVIMRSSDGMTKDSKFDKHWALAQKHRVWRGAYHFYRASEDPVQQAEHFLSTMGAPDPRTIAPIVDFEKLGVKKAARSQTAETISARLLTALEHIEKKTGRTPIIYTNVSDGNKYLGHHAFSRFPLWVADWTKKDKPTLPKAWKSTGYTFWQQTNKYTFAGQNPAPVDMDLYSGSEPQVLPEKAK